MPELFDEATHTHIRTINYSHPGDVTKPEIILEWLTEIRQRLSCEDALRSLHEILIVHPHASKPAVDSVSTIVMNGFNTTERSFTEALTKFIMNDWNFNSEQVGMRRYLAYYQEARGCVDPLVSWAHDFAYLFGPEGVYNNYTGPDKSPKQVEGLVGLIRGAFTVSPLVSEDKIIGFNYDRKKLTWSWRTGLLRRKVKVVDQGIKLA